MNPLLIVFFFLSLAVSQAYADPSVSSDAGRSIDNGQSDTIKHDKSLSADKSRGNRATESDSRERAREKSLSNSHQERVGSSRERSRSSSVDVNINGLLLREFTARYERGNSWFGAAGDYFHTCKPMMSLKTDYPIIAHFYPGSKQWDDHVTGKNKGWSSVSNENLSDIRLLPHQVGNGAHKSENIEYVARYMECRIAANYWIAEAGDRVATQKALSEAEISDRIRATFIQMDDDDSLFTQLQKRAENLLQQAQCVPFLTDYAGAKTHEIECGVFSYVGDRIEVENRETLSESSINGRSYKIAISAQESQSASEDDSVSRDAKVSASVRDSDSRERFREVKKTANMSKSKSRDQSSSSKVDRSAGNSMNATPKE